jgi:hypothetical protein
MEDERLRQTGREKISTTGHQKKIGADLRPARAVASGHSTSNRIAAKDSTAESQRSSVFNEYCPAERGSAAAARTPALPPAGAA